MRPFSILHPRSIIFIPFRFKNTLHFRKRRDGLTLIDFFQRRYNASFTQEPNWFETLSPENEIGSCQFFILKRSHQPASFFLISTYFNIAILLITLGFHVQDC